MGIPGLVEIGADEVGIVRRKFGSKLPPGRYISLNGEAGYEADILPPGMHPGYFSWQYEIRKVPIVNVPQGEIGLVVAKDGQPIPRGRNLGRMVECDDFQNARAFLEMGGEKGRQLGILRSGTYSINTELFTVITSANAVEHKVNPEDLYIYKVEPDKVGIVTTYDGQPIPSGEMAGCTVRGHNNFQDPQQFIDIGGCNGLQEEVLPSGEWELNPWFVSVEQVPLTKIEPGRVGVVVSHVGKIPYNNNNAPVNRGYKGVWAEPLYQGKHSINTRVMDVVIVPTHEITLDWSNKPKPRSNYDSSLRALTLRSRDGFAFEIEVTQVIRIDGLDAPKMISRIGSAASRIPDSDEPIEPSSLRLTSIRNLVIRVLEPMIGNYFRNSAQYYNALDFHRERSGRQQDAMDHIKSALDSYGVQSVGTFINEIDLPDRLENILTERGAYEIEIQGHETAVQAQKNRQILEYEKAYADAQKNIVDIRVEADAIRQRGAAQADVLRLEIEAQVEVLGVQNFLEKHRIDNWRYVQLPSCLVNTSGDRAGLMDAFIAPMLGGSTVSTSHALPGRNGQTPQLSASSEVPTNKELKPSLPRCPVILLLDTSQSMTEAYKEALLKGINRFEEELLQDNIACRCVEVSIITFGGSAKVVQTFAKAGEFSLDHLELSGETSMGLGIAIALKNIARRETLYASQNIYHYKPWVILITGSAPEDDWQPAAQDIKQAVADDRLTFLTVGVDDIKKDILNQIAQIAPPKTPPTILEDLKFEPLFYGFADLLKRVANRQRRERLLEELTLAVEETTANVPAAQVQQLTTAVAELIAEVTKERVSYDSYIKAEANLIQIARTLRAGQRIIKSVSYLNKSLGFTHEIKNKYNTIEF